MSSGVLGLAQHFWLAFKTTIAPSDQWLGENKNNLQYGRRTYRKIKTKLHVTESTQQESNELSKLHTFHMLSTPWLSTEIQTRD
jgi:hypothetical protein